MTAKIHRLHNSSPIAGYLRGGHRENAVFDHGDDKALKVIQNEKKRLTLMNDVFADMLVDCANRTRSNSPLFRGNSNSLAILGRGA